MTLDISIPDAATHSVDITLPRTLHDMSDRELLIRMNERMDTILEIAKTIEGEVKPTLDSLTANPMIRALIGGKK